MDGTTIRFFRRALDLTQRDVAGVLGCSPAWVQQIERNRSTPTRTQLKKLEELLGLPLLSQWTGRKLARLRDDPARKKRLARLRDDHARGKE